MRTVFGVFLTASDLDAPAAATYSAPQLGLRWGAMISVVIPTLNAEATLAATLTALVPAAVDGLVREVIVVDGGSTDQTAAIVEDAGAQLIRKSGGRGHQLTVGALRAKQPWLLFLHADTVLEAGWEREASLFMERTDAKPDRASAAVFRFALDDIGGKPRLLERLVAARYALFRLPYGDQGLLIPRTAVRRGGRVPAAAADGGRRFRPPPRPPADNPAVGPSRNQRRTLPAGRLPAPLRPQPDVPDAVLRGCADQRHQPAVRVARGRDRDACCSAAPKNP